MSHHIAVLPGDGIGPEVVAQATRVLRAVERAYGREITLHDYPVGGEAIDQTGVPLPDATLAGCRNADAILLGAIGGPAWSDPTAAVRPEQGLLELRQQLGLFANLRPVRTVPALLDASPLRRERIEGTDLLVVRELTGGIYFGPRREAGADGVAEDTMRYERSEIERIARLAFRLAAARRGTVVSIDKANILATSRWWRRTVTDVAADYPDVQLEHLLVDAAAMHLLHRAPTFDVLLTANLFGDILSDEASMLAGSLGMLPSASLGDGGGGVYEPVHGSAPDIVGRDIANPIGAILSVGLLLRHAFGWEDEADTVERAVDEVLSDGARTADLAGPKEAPIGTEAMGERIVAAVHRMAAWKENR